MRHETDAHRRYVDENVEVRLNVVNDSHLLFSIGQCFAPLMVQFEGITELHWKDNRLF